jgi:iron complex transport system substrate-binding protein
MRILSLSPVTTELLYAIGAGNHVVGRTELCDYPEAARNLPSIGELAPETVEIFEPDLVLVGAGQHALAQELLPRWHVILYAPDSVEDLWKRMSALGIALHTDVEADMVVHDLRQQLERVQERCSAFKPVRVYLHNADDFMRDLVRVAGGEPHDGEQELAKFDPQFLIAPDEQTLALLQAKEELKKSLAVQHERLFVMEYAALRPTPRVIQGAKQLAKLLHGVNGTFT